MPEYVAVCCFQCKLFQGQQLNKQRKFKCKVCGEKQSFRHIYAKSDYPKDIRVAVQQLNQKRGEMEEQPTVPVQSEYVAPKSEPPCKESKWAQFLETKQDDNSNEEDTNYITDSSVLYPAKPKDRPRRQRMAHKQRAAAPKIEEMPPPIPKISEPKSQPKSEAEELVFVTDIDYNEDQDNERTSPSEVRSINKKSMWSTFL